MEAFLLDKNGYSYWLFLRVSLNKHFIHRFTLNNFCKEYTYFLIGCHQNIWWLLISCSGVKANKFLFTGTVDQQIISTISYFFFSISKFWSNLRVFSNSIGIFWRLELGSEISRVLSLMTSDFCFLTTDVFLLYHAIF